MKIKVFIVLIILLSITMMMSCSRQGKKSGELSRIRVTLDWTPNTNHTGLYVAKELGYFEAEGLDVEILQPGQNTTDQIVASGNSEFGISYQENVVLARAQSIPLVSIAAIIQHNSSGFASLKSAGINSPKDFENKRYGSWDSPSELAILKTVMRDAGADFSKVQIVSGVYDFFTTIGKDADFEWIYEAWTGVEAAHKGIELNYIPLRELNPIFDYYTPVIISSEKYLAENPEIAEKFMRAVSKAYDFCIKNPDQAAEILLKHVPELDARLVRSSQQYLAPRYQAEAARWGMQEEHVWKRFIDWCFDNRLIEMSVEADKAYTNRFLP